MPCPTAAASIGVVSQGRGVKVYARRESIDPQSRRKITRHIRMLGYRARDRATWPILRREFDAPEVRAGREEFNSHARAFVGRIAQVDHAALLLFLGDWV